MEEILSHVRRKERRLNKYIISQKKYLFVFSKIN